MTHSNLSVLQEEQVHKELSEKEQLKKCPNKRFSTFLLHPDKPIPEPTTKIKQEVELEHEQLNKSNTELLTPTLQSDKTKESNICPSPTIITSQYEDDDKNEIDNTACNTELSIEKQKSISHPEVNELIDGNEIAITEQSEVRIEEVIDGDTAPSDNFEEKLNQIKDTLTALGQLPSLIQSQLETIQSQLNYLLQSKDEQISTIITNTQQLSSNEEEYTEKSDSLILQETELNVQNPIEEIDGSIDVEQETNPDQIEDKLYAEDISSESIEKSETHVENQIESDTRNEQLEDEDAEERELHRRRICPLTPQPRPVVLPGGRIWRKPKDAYNEDFIAETLISQAEVLVGSTLGVNFRKYEPPKFDVSNSAVYKLIHNLDGRKGGLEERQTIPTLEDCYQSPANGFEEKSKRRLEMMNQINAKHFYLASLADNVRVISEENEVNDGTISSE